MDVLWFTNTSSCYYQSNDYNGGGWISSLEVMIKKNYPEINLAIAFYDDKVRENWKKVEGDNVVYYPIRRPRQSMSFRAKQFMGSRKKASLEYEEYAMPQFLEIVKDFQPDIIHVFGSENIYGLLSRHTDVPVVLHIQGLLSSYINSFLPPAISWNDYLFSKIRLKSILWHLREKLAFERNSFSEIRILKSVKFYMGRTSWDKSIISLVNPAAHYFYCGEVLREAFYVPAPRKESTKPIFVSVLSWQIYKGYDLVLKTANLLKEFGDLEFEWHIYGNINPEFMEKKFNLSSEHTSIVFKGIAQADELKSALLSATALIHPSYIENSSNVICEAQISGCPVIATNVGGTSSLIDHGNTGLLIPANDPYTLAHNMKLLLNNHSLRTALSENAIKVARERHEKNKIAARVYEIYQIISSL